MNPLDPGFIAHKKCEVMGLLRTAALKSGVKALAAIRTQILRTCLLQAHGINSSTRDRFTNHYAFLMYMCPEPC